MRVLVLALLCSCYSPSVGDCQFRCGGMGDCPDGTDCRNGFCRTAAGSCAAADASNPCPGAPPAPSNCSNKFALVEPAACGVICSGQRQHDEVMTACGPSWRAGILDQTAELDAVPSGEPRYWVGAGRATTASEFTWTNGVPVDAGAWDTGYPNLTGSSCVYLESSRRRLRNDRSCGDDEAYICTFPAS